MPHYTFVSSSALEAMGVYIGREIGKRRGGPGTRGIGPKIDGGWETEDWAAAAGRE